MCVCVCVCVCVCIVVQLVAVGARWFGHHVSSFTRAYFLYPFLINGVSIVTLSADTRHVPTAFVRVRRHGPTDRRPANCRYVGGLVLLPGRHQAG